MVVLQQLQLIRFYDKYPVLKEKILAAILMTVAVWNFTADILLVLRNILKTKIKILSININFWKTVL